MKPDEHTIFVEHTNKHRVQAMSHIHLVVVGSDPKLQERVYVHIAQVDLGLVVVDVVNLPFIVYDLMLVDLYKRLFRLKVCGLRIFESFFLDILGAFVTQFEMARGIKFKAVFFLGSELQLVVDVVLVAQPQIIIKLHLFVFV